ncbi:MAG: hypothetical protein NTY38_28610 [Acidobacteria bacterium]|nr:hypothetical protein [Acidobacteriota bacterium]
MKLRSDRNNLRNALYAEFTSNIDYVDWYYYELEHWKLLGKYANVSFPKVHDLLRVEVYKHAQENQSVLFRSIPESRIIIEFQVFAGKLTGIPSLEELKQVIFVLSLIKPGMAQGKLSRRLLNKYSNQSRFKHPIRRWPYRIYSKLTWRNIPKDGKSRGFLPNKTFQAKLKAIWKGVPGKEQLYDFSPRTLPDAPAPPPRSAPQTPTNPPG